MSNKKIYILLVIVGAAGAIAGILMRRSGGPSLQNAAAVLGWSGIAILLIVRVVFGRATRRTK